MKAYRTEWVENAILTTPFFRHKKVPLGTQITFSHFLVKIGTFWEAFHGSKKAYLAKTTAWKASRAPKLSKCTVDPPSNRDLAIFGLTPSNRDLAREGGWRGEGVFGWVGVAGLGEGGCAGAK